MFILAPPTRQERGKLRPKRDAEAAEAVRGDLTISLHDLSNNGRMTKVAVLHRADAADAPLSPPLHHVELSWMGANGFVLTGIEFVEDVAYGQSWWCRTP